MLSFTGVAVEDGAGPRKSTWAPTETRTVQTANGTVAQIALYGSTSLPLLITVHGIGLNARSCFQSFFSRPKSCKLFEELCVAHVTLPGHEDGAPDVTPYPPLENCCELLTAVCDSVGAKRFFGLGFGAGGYVLCRYASQHPERIRGLILLSPSLQPISWMEHSLDTVHSYLAPVTNLLAPLANVTAVLPTALWSNSIEDDLVRQYFAPDTVSNNLDLIEAFRADFKQMNATNVSAFAEVFKQRKDLSAELKTIIDPVLYICGTTDPVMAEGVVWASHFKPDVCSYIRIQRTGALVQLEEPDELITPIRLYLQGFGFVCKE